MHKGFGPSLQIDLSGAGITLGHARGWLPRIRPACVNTAWAGDIPLSPDRVRVPLSTMLIDAKCGGARTTIILSDDWVRTFLVTPPHNTARLRDCEAAAAMRFQALYGEPATDWQLEADWDARQPFLACAMPRSLLEMLQQVALDHALPLIAIMPRFIAAWHQWRSRVQPDAWFGVIHGHVLTLGAIHLQRLCVVRTTPLPPSPDPHWLAEHVAREALRHNLPTPGQVQLCGDVPDAWVAHATDAFMCTRLGTQQHAPDQMPVSANATVLQNGSGR